MNIGNIIDGCLKHDRICQKQLYDYCYPYGMKVVSAYVHDVSERSEVLNDAFFKLFTSLERFDSSKPILPWFRTILVRTIVNQYHTISKISNLSEITDETLEKYAAPDNALLQIEAEGLLALVHELPPVYKLVLNLYAIEGYTHAEIAELLKISEGTSKSNLSKARKYLNNLIAKSKFLVLF